MINIHNAPISIICNRLRILLCVLVIACISCSKEENNSLNVGGFIFGSHRQQAIDNAKSLGYDVEYVGDYVLDVTGDINALGIKWEILSIMADPENGIKQIILTRKFSETSPEMMSKHFNEMIALFPNSEKKQYFESFTITDTYSGRSVSSKFDMSDVFELKDEKDKYSGSSYYILSKDQFSTIIYLNHTKD